MVIQHVRISLDVIQNGPLRGLGHTVARCSGRERKNNHRPNTANHAAFGRMLRSRNAVGVCRYQTCEIYAAHPVAKKHVKLEKNTNAAKNARSYYNAWIPQSVPPSAPQFKPGATTRILDQPERMRGVRADGLGLKRSMAIAAEKTTAIG